MAILHAPGLTAVVRSILHLLPKKFSRERLTGPRQMLMVLLTTIHSGVNRIGIRPARILAMRQLGGFLGWRPGHMPSTSASCRALRKLTSSMLRQVIDHGLSELTKAMGPSLLIHRRRLVAIDGVRINARRTSILARWLGLPKQDEDRKAHQPQALVVSARCVVTNVTLAQEIVRHDGSERHCARRLIDRLSAMGPMLVVLDRGFPARDLIAQLVHRRMDFVVRMCGGRRAWRELHGRDTGRSHDRPVNLRLRGIDGRWTTCRLRTVLTVRITRGRPRCDRTPHRALLLTNLTARYWSKDRIIAAYRRRWDIETTFREDKRLLGATRSHATTRSGFANELLALEIYRLLMALAGHVAMSGHGRPRWDDPHAVRLSTPQLIVAAWWLVELACAARGNGEDPLLMAILEIWRDAEKKRPFRAFKRICKGVEGAWKNKTEKGRR
jgi:hypothetical protein